MEVILKAIVFCNGEIENYSFINKYLDDCSMVICCDGGLRHAHNIGIFPDYILGDFDSVNNETLNNYEKRGSKLIKYNTEKDFTDTEIAIDFVLNKNASEILIFGGIGSRFDHTLSNLQILKKPLEKNVDAFLIDENNIIRLINSDLTVFGEVNSLISLLPLAQTVSGITTYGLKYKLCNETIEIGSSRGISNVFIENEAKISIKSGILIVIKTHD